MKQTKTLILLLFLALASVVDGYAFDDILGNPADKKIILAGTGMKPKLADPDATYNELSRMLTIEFPTAGFVPYTLSISSELNTLDYYITSPLTSVYISPEVVEVDVQLATDGGDLYYGSFEATSSTLSE